MSTGHTSVNFWQSQYCFSCVPVCYLWPRTVSFSFANFFLRQCYTTRWRSVVCSVVCSTGLSCDNREPRSLEILMFVSLCLYEGNRPSKSPEILMLVYLQKDAKQCCDASKFDCTQCVQRQHIENSRASSYYSIVFCHFVDQQTIISHKI